MTERTCETCEHYDVQGGEALCHRGGPRYLGAYNASCEDHKPKEENTDA